MKEQVLTPYQALNERIEMFKKLVPQYAEALDSIKQAATDYINDNRVESWKWLGDLVSGQKKYLRTNGLKKGEVIEISATTIDGTHLEPNTPVLDIQFGR